MLAGIGFADLGNGTNHHLSGQFELIANAVVAQMLQLCFAESFRLKGKLADNVTSGVKAFHSSQKLFGLFGRRT